MHSRRFAAFAAMLLTFASLTFGFAGDARAAKPETYTPALSNLAVEGYDAVAYFEEGAPVKGDAAFEISWRGATWRFSTAEHLALFQANPESYAPQYGGYCAWAVAHGYTARGNPKNWTIFDGKLYLNYNDKVQADWMKDVPGYVAKGDANWPQVLEK